jgi:ankyrin repeat protein
MTNETIYLSNGLLKPKRDLERALKLGASPDEGWTSLHEAVVGGRMDALDLLVSYGADLEVQDGDGDTALMRACTTNALPEETRLLMIERLIHHGAEVNHTNYVEETPLLACVKNARAVAMLVLLRSGAYLDTVDREGRSIDDLADEYSPECADALRVWAAERSKDHLMQNVSPKWTETTFKPLLLDQPLVIARKLARKL